MNSKQKVRYFKSYDDDFFENKPYSLPQNYKWVRKDSVSRFLSCVIYALAFVFSSVYCRLFLHVKFKGAKKLRRQKGGFFIYGNHTMPIGDVFNPALASFPKRIYTVVSTQNMALKVIGKILVYLGALPIPQSLRQMQEFTSAVGERVEGGHPVVIYPEAHLWEYCTQIRPFNESAFKFPIKFNKPVYSMTATFQKSRFFKKPKVTIFVDGPFEADGENPRKRAESLCKNVREQMIERSKNSTYEYIRYEKV